jgi:hypothetical protein
MVSQLEDTITNKISANDGGMLMDVPSDPAPPQNHYDDNPLWINYAKMLTHLYLKIVIRLTDKSQLPRMHKLVKSMMAKSETLCLWLIDNMTEKNAIRDFLVECPVMDMKYMTCGLIKTAITKICEGKPASSLTEAQFEALAKSLNSPKDLLATSEQNPTLVNEQLDRDLVVQKFVAVALHFCYFRTTKLKFMKQVFEI